MTTMTEILAAHAYDVNDRDCLCMVYETRSPEKNYDEWAVHVAAALETAGYGLVEGEKEWGVTWDGALSDPLQSVSLDAAKNGAASIAKITSDGAEPYVVSRTVTAWKKEA